MKIFIKSTDSRYRFLFLIVTNYHVIFCITNTCRLIHGWTCYFHFFLSCSLVMIHIILLLLFFSLFMDYILSWFIVISYTHCYYFIFLFFSQQIYLYNYTYTVCPLFSYHYHQRFSCVVVFFLSLIKLIVKHTLSHMKLTFEHFCFLKSHDFSVFYKKCWYSTLLFNGSMLERL
jgi:hypothetical protein